MSKPVYFNPYSFPFHPEEPFHVSFNNLSEVEHARNQEYIHRVNVDKGWFDKPVSFLEAMALIVTEVVEVNDAYRDEGLLGGWSAGPHMASEFADCYIRLADDASRFLVDLGVQVETYRFTYEWRRGTSFDGVCMQLIRRVRDAIESYRKCGLTEEGGVLPDTAKHLAWFFLQLQETCDNLGVNLQHAVMEKMEINKGRAYRHGNKHA